MMLHNQCTKYNLIFIMLYFLLYIFGNAECFHIDQIRDSDPDLAKAVKLVAPEFDSSLKRRFTNVGVSKELRQRGGFAKSSSIRLGDTFFKEDKNQITLKDLILERLPIARLNNANTNLLEKHLRISAEWNDVALKGSYEMTNSSQLNLLPVHNTGKIEINIDKVTTAGLVGFQLYGDALKTTNYNLDFKAEDLSVEVEYRDYETGRQIRSRLKRKSIDQTLAKYIKRDLYWKLQETLRSQLDQVLIDYSINEIFQDDKDITSKYLLRSVDVDDFVNKMADMFIRNIRSVIIARGLSNITAPDIKTDFSHEFGTLTIWGYFEAKKGFIYDFSRITKTGKFSILFHPNGDFEIWGSFGFPKLQVKYEYYHASIWNIGPRGELNASVESTNVNFKVVGAIKNIIPFDFIIKDYSFRIAQLEDISVQATGLSILLNWLLSHIITWITGHLKNDIVTVLEKELKTVLDKHLIPT